MKTLEEIKKSVLADGIIDADEAAMIREVIFADGKIDKEEAEFMFEINDAVSGHKNDVAWKNLMVDAISSYLLDDETTPGEIDDEEAEWLKNKIMSDGQLDEVEKAIAENIKKKAKKISPKFNI